MLIVKRTGSVSRRHLATENFSEWFLWVKSHLAKIWKSWIRWTYRCQSIWQSWNLLFTGPEVFEFVRWWEVGTDNCRDTLEILNYLLTRALCVFEMPYAYPGSPFAPDLPFRLNIRPFHCLPTSMYWQLSTILYPIATTANVNSLLATCGVYTRLITVRNLASDHIAILTRASAVGSGDLCTATLSAAFRYDGTCFSVSVAYMSESSHESLSGCSLPRLLCSRFSDNYAHSSHLLHITIARWAIMVRRHPARRYPVKPAETHQRQSTCKRKLWTSASTSSNNSERTRSWNPKQHSCSNRSYLMKPSRRTRLSWLTGPTSGWIHGSVAKRINPKTLLAFRFHSFFFWRCRRNHFHFWKGNGEDYKY